jgi:hypothetical protein
VAAVVEADCVAVQKSERCSVPAAMRLARPARLARRRPDPLGPGLVSRVGWSRGPVPSG